jgi:phosphate starvation-inducible PhoH-like protein
MASLLGSRDEYLRQIERSFPGTDIHVRGNEITIAGDEAAKVGQLFEELVLLLQAGQPLDSADLSRSIDMVPRSCGAPRAGSCGPRRAARSATSTPSATT